MPIRPLTPLAIAASVLYGAALRARSTAYERGWLRTWRASRPVISVGNLTAGGSGKTPLVAWIAARLLAAGVPCGVLTRGYGRPRRAPRLLAAHAPLPDWSVIGDEPWLLARRLPGLALGVDSRRGRAAARLAPRLPGGVLLLDDGFQHRRLARDLEIVTLAAGDPLGGGRLLPAGRLREPPAALARADWIVVTIEAGDTPPAIAAARRLAARHAPQAAIAEAQRTWQGALPFVAAPARGRAARPASPAAALPEPVLLVAGIARPERFARQVAVAGIAVAAARYFPDHHPYSAAAARALRAAARRAGARSILTTEKDAPRLAAVWDGCEPFWIGCAELVVGAGGPALARAVLDCAQRRR